MQELNTQALSNPAALRYARNVIRDIRNGICSQSALRRRGVPESLCADVQTILEANGAGWFPLPAGRGLTYSRTQFGTLHQHSAHAPWLRALIETAERFEEHRRRTPPVAKAFGVIPLPNWLFEARAAHSRLPRLPLEHVVGAITVPLWLQCLQDSKALALRLEREMDCFTPDWMWDPDHPLTDQVARLRSMDCLYLLKAYVSSTRNRRLDTYESALLDDVQYRGLGVDQYEASLRAEALRRDGEAEASWRLNYQLIRRAASILDEISTYHHGTISRRIKAASNGAFRLVRSGLEGYFSLELRHQYEIGRGQRLSSVFELVNYCLALSDALEGQAPSFSVYLQACEVAAAQVRSMYAPVTQAAG